MLAARGEVAETRHLLSQIAAAGNIGQDNAVVVGALELAALAKRKSALSSGQLKRARALAKRHPAWSRRAAF
ncbi:MAG: hypothetical protein E6J91_23105 [Deltaproteobacteria bacterium]|nr:MAG: hypothetical protein E6J91_23105 [Deltaproteobacteria bacterium]